MPKGTFAAWLEVKKQLTCLLSSFCMWMRTKVPYWVTTPPPPGLGYCKFINVCEGFIWRDFHNHIKIAKIITRWAKPQILIPANMVLFQKRKHKSPQTLMNLHYRPSWWLGWYQHGTLGSGGSWGLHKFEALGRTYEVSGGSFASWLSKHIYTVHVLQ